MIVLRLIFFISLLSANTEQLLINVISGINEIKKDRSWLNCDLPTEAEIRGIAAEIDRSPFRPLDVVALFAAESRWNKKAVSCYGAGSVAQLMPTTKKYLLSKYGERDQKSCVQDVRLAILLLKECADVIGYNNFIYLTWAYNAGCSTVINGGWITNNANVWIQPRELTRALEYYRKNFDVGIFDIDVDFPGWRYGKESHDDKVFERIGRPHKKIIVSISKKILTADGKNYCVGLGEMVSNKCRTPIGEWRFIWRIWYSRGVKEGGPFGVCFMRLNTKRPSDGTNIASVGLHGTDDEKKIGTYNSWGCIQLSNKDAATIYSNFVIGDYLIVKP